MACYRQPLPSKARLRTRSGCQECMPYFWTPLLLLPTLTTALCLLGRRRRKKCDEKRPRCGGCTRNTLSCTWPAESQLLDRRASIMNTSMAEYYLPALSISSTEKHLSLSMTAMPPPFREEEHFRLYRYFAHCVLPQRLVRQTSLSRYSDQKHMLQLAIAYPPLMGATIAVAAMKETRQSQCSVRLAVEGYLFTINNLREGIARGKYTGNEDWLLATTVLLCVFEVLPPIACLFDN